MNYKELEESLELRKNLTLDEALELLDVPNTEYTTRDMLQSCDYILTKHASR